MNGFLRFVINRFTSILPHGKFFGLKNYLYNLIPGVSIKNARITSTFEVWGIGKLTIGEDTFIGHQSLIHGSNDTSVCIGDRVDISTRVNIITGSHEIDPSGTRIAGKGSGANIVIEEGAWIGIGATILPGVTIGKFSIVAAGSVVNRDVEKFTIVAGVPAKIIKSIRERDDI